MTALRVLIVADMPDGRFSVTPVPPIDGRHAVFDDPRAALDFADEKAACWPELFAGYRDEVRLHG